MLPLCEAMCKCLNWDLHGWTGWAGFLVVVWARLVWGIGVPFAFGISPASGGNLWLNHRRVDRVSRAKLV